ncbi:MAG: ABC transporter permease [Thaumarchaeota archaeon]|nr:ABC transporter permease [Nitrososphaerota archaeon]
MLEIITKPLEIITKSLIFTELELRKVRHDPIDIFVRSIQPALWIIVFGSIFSRIRDLPTDGIPYIQFMTPGILAQSVMFMAIFTGISIVWERDLGQMSKLLAAPVPRSSIAIGKALAAGVRGLMQAITIFALAIVLQIPIIFNPLYIIAVILVVFALGAAFASVSTFIALVLKTRDRVMGVSQIMTMPLFFASNALYPISLMPPWLQAVALVNPLSYVVSALRALLITGDLSHLPIDLLGVAITSIIFISLSSIAFRRVGD